MKSERYLKVYSQNHNNKNLPYIRLRGKWLEKAGFDPGSTITINTEYGKIIITNDIYNAVKGLPDNESDNKEENLEQIVKNVHKNTRASFYKNEYHGYKVKLKLERDKNFRPYKITNPDDVYNFFKPLKYEPREKFLSVFLDGNCYIAGVDEVGLGDTNRVEVSPTEIFKSALVANSNKILMVHNHPSGDPTPSENDMIITRKMVEASKVLEIRILDHIVIGNESYKSIFTLLNR